MYIIPPYIATSLMIISIIITIFLFFYFSRHIKKYNKLIAMYYEKGFTLNALYGFYFSMGFFGSFNIAYYFSRLKKGKNVIFSPEKKQEITIFLKKTNPEYTNWLDTYYTLSCIVLLLLFIFTLLSVVDILMRYL